MNNLICLLIPLLLGFNSHLSAQKQTNAKDLNPPPPPACGGAVGINLNPGGYFGSGTDNIPATNPDLSSDYVFSPTAPPPPGSYTLTNNTSSWATNLPSPEWIDIGDNSSDPEGYMMVINGQEDTAIFVEWEIEGLCPGINYEFAAEIINLIDSTTTLQGLPKLDFLINGEVLGNTGEIPQDESWHSIGFTFTPNGIQSSLRISLRNNTISDTGNDFAIDNVSLRPCGPSLVLEEVMPAAHCPKEEVEVALGIGTGPGAPVIQWQVSQNEGESWQDFGTPGTQTSLIIPSLPAQTALRALVAEDMDQINRPSCRYISNALAFDYLPVESCPSTIIDTTICAGEMFMVGTNTFFASGTYQVLLEDHMGRDSLVQLELTIAPPIIFEKNIGICKGDIFEGISYEQDTTLMYMETAANGCDSLSLLHIVILPAPEPQILGPTHICEGNSDQLTLPETYINYQWSTGASSPSLAINSPGTYSVTVMDDGGCPGQQQWEVLETAIIADYSIEPPSCAATVDGIIRIEAIQGGSGNYIVSLDGKIIPESSLAVEAGTFSLRIEDSKGCIFEENITILPAEPLQLLFEPQYQINSGQSTPLNIDSNWDLVFFEWSAHDDLSCTDCLEPIASPGHTTRFELYAEDVRGCTADAQITVVVKQKLAVFAPNAFSPNEDGINDFFALYGGDELSEVSHLKIFDRWGALVYSGAQIGIGEGSWDGTFRGQALPDGVYVYQAEVLGDNGKVEFVIGEVALMR